MSIVRWLWRCVVVLVAGVAGVAGVGVPAGASVSVLSGPPAGASVSSGAVGMQARAAQRVRVVSARVSGVSARCHTQQIRTFNHVDYRRFGFRRVCVAEPAGLTAGGLSYPWANRFEVMSSPSTPGRDVDAATAHELTHMMDYRWMSVDRARMYRFVGVRARVLAYGSVVSGTQQMTVRVWEQNPRERLAESVAHCVTGEVTFPGMRLVPSGECGALLSAYRVAWSHARS